jgi:Mrp family chromosome partitioning ATPase
MGKLRSFFVGTLLQEQLTLLTDYDPDSAYSVAYQTVYANVRFNWDSERSKHYAIAISTPAPYRGQAAVAANVAIAAAQSTTPVILVDADLQTQSLQQRFGVGENVGLSDLLTKETISQQTITSYLHKVFVPGLYLLCAGGVLAQAQKRSRLLSTKLHEVLVSLRQFLADTESGPGIIIVHSPPVLAGIEATQIGALVDQTFLAIVARHTTRTQALRALEQLQRAKVPVAGTITLNI